MFVALVASASAANAQAPDRKASRSQAENVVEPSFPVVAPGTLPANLKALAIVQAMPDQRTKLVQTPPFCLSRLSVLVESAGGTDELKMFASNDKMLNVEFRSRPGSEITLHCLANIHAGVPDRKLYNVRLSMIDDTTAFVDLLRRVAGSLYGWRSSDLDVRVATCLTKAKRPLQKDLFGVMPDTGTLKGIECYTGRPPAIVLFAPDTD
ncbi:hypothetical protein [Rhodopseudomonas telluris]|uniref:Uncharacterized protein n=1 Tax=Rhodopseudomonas telluris TaxID=644215 RepID=A0ABV6F137_9BRAD